MPYAGAYADPTDFRDPLRDARPAAPAEEPTPAPVVSTPAPAPQIPAQASAFPTTDLVSVSPSLNPVGQGSVNRSRFAALFPEDRALIEGIGSLV